MPGMTVFPVASMIRAPAGADTFVPTATILPSRIKTLPLVIGAPAAVWTVPPRTRIAPPWARTGSVRAAVAVMAVARSRVARIIAGSGWRGSPGARASRNRTGDVLPINGGGVNRQGFTLVPNDPGLFPEIWRRQTVGNGRRQTTVCRLTRLISCIRGALVE